MNWVGSTLFDQATQCGESVAQLCMEYRLDGMLGLHTLKRLQLERYAPATFADKVLKNLVEWFRAGLMLNYEGKALSSVTVTAAQAHLTPASAEYLALALKATTFTIHSGAGNDRFQDWPGGLDLSIFSSHYGNGYSAVKSLSFPYFSWFHHQLCPATTPNNDIELMGKCPNLESVTMNWANDTLLDKTSSAQHVLLAAFTISKDLQPACR
ncbi:hypothetical protein LTR56_014572 [Elasticomyces elasticus]|nr:hypothetical protein LTR56_014572 [Elasticomyces elasticus]KAK3646796.1 hypothetical protein LTR22_014172 [Elasticomyces elasticus]KAK4916361.1 hypothetical protein LTR49_015595 [Elasticomyces elasticus]KAK5755833.1 hypothetical protein LTS12_014064 [Elasticomyces elasticus]